MQIDSWVFFLLGAVYYLLALVSVAREVFYGRTAQGSIAWIIALLLFPLPTVLVYFIFGWKRFDGYAARQLELGAAQRAAQARQLDLLAEEPTHDWPVQVAVARTPFLSGNRVELLIDGEATFESILSGIDAAQIFIAVQFYIVRDDALGRRLAEKLIHKAEAGIHVYFLYDDVGSAGLPRAYLKRLQDAGVMVSGFNKRHSLVRFLGPMQINYRNHRKLVVVDNRVAWVGGHNVGVEYLGQSPHFGRWRDTHVRVEGPAVVACILSFGEDWRWATGQPFAEALRVPEPVGVEPVLVMPTGPATKLEECAIAFVDGVLQARERLWIVSPYFVPDIDMVTALRAASLRGVDVRILLPEKVDHRIVWLAGYSYADDFTSSGIAVYRYRGGFLHQKAMLIDDKIASIGTVNLDNRSFRINFELTLLFTDEAFLRKVCNMLEEDFAHSVRVRQGDLDNRSYLFRIAARTARLFSPIL